MTLAAVAAWLTVALGAVLSYWCVLATLYFRHQLKLMGGNWLLLAFYRTAATITAVCIWLTLARTIALLFGAQWWISLISGLAIIWLLLIPILLRRLFAEHEGR
jgi:hypothetical protein